MEGKWRGLIRQVGDITYRLTQKRVKNINLRVMADGEVAVSAGRQVPLSEIDRFVLSKADWIVRARVRAASRSIENTHFSDAECLRVFTEISDGIYPLFKKSMPEKPLIKIRKMKSCWGVCHYKKGYITLNSGLLAKPRAAIEYVILHEYAHFFEPNHGAGFHSLMKSLMPDYKERRKLLK